MLSKSNNDKISNNKKTAWELLKEIPDTPIQRKIDREIAAIERKYEEKYKRKSKTIKHKNNNKMKITKINNSEDFGLFAGKIWNVLNVYGPQDKSLLLHNTKLNMDDFFIGIGWLARENKISKEMNYYKLDNTNLTGEIGKNAGKIWTLLNYQGQVDITYIIKSTGLKIENVYSAIGWLSRENKIKVINKDGHMIYELT